MSRFFLLFSLGIFFLSRISAFPLYAQNAVRPLDVSTTILPLASEGEVSISPNISSSQTLEPGQEITYTIRYRSQSSGSWPFTIQSSWTQGLIDGTSSNYIDVADYVVGSANNTDNNVSPVIDIQNQTITWTISSLTNSSSFHEVKFNLRIRSDIPLNQLVTGSVKVNGKLNGVDLTQDSTTLKAKRSSVTPTPTATTTPSPTPTPETSTTTTTESITSTPSPTPTPIISLRFNQIQLKKVTSSETAISIVTNLPTSTVIYYGLTPQSLNETVSSLDYVSNREISFSKLKPNTSYYFRIFATSSNNKIIRSDIFTFRTAQTENILDLTTSDVTIASNNFILFAPSFDTTNHINSIVTTPARSLTISIKTKDPKDISSIRVKIENNRVLGLTADALETPLQEVRLLELLPGIFSGEIKSPLEQGRYDIVLQVKNRMGGFSLQTLPQKVQVSTPLTILSRLTGKPIENASVLIKKQVAGNNNFIPLESALSYKYETDEKGALNVVLPEGTYEISIRAIGYQTETQKIIVNDHNGYPKILLKPNFSFGETIRYYFSAFNDTSKSVTDGVNNIFISQRALDTSFLFIVISVFLCGLLSLSLRLHTNLMGVPFWTVQHIIHYIKHLFGIKETEKIFIVYEGNNYHKSLTGVRVLIMDKRNRVILSTKTDLIGKIKVPLKTITSTLFPLTIFTYRKGYHSFPTNIDKQSLMFETISLFMTKEIGQESSFSTFTLWLLDLGFIFVSDVLFILVVLTTVLVIFYQGMITAIPYISMSILLFIFWFIYLHQIWKFQREENHYSP